MHIFVHIERRDRFAERESSQYAGEKRAGATGLEPATSGVTGRRSNQLNYAPRRCGAQTALGRS